MLEHIIASSCNILIADIVMPCIKWFKLTKKVKQTLPDTNVIEMTDFMDNFSFDQTIELGASDSIKESYTKYEMLLRIQHVYLQEKLRKISNTVELTGLYKRRGFFAIVQHQLKVANRGKR